MIDLPSQYIRLTMSYNIQVRSIIVKVIIVKVIYPSDIFNAQNEKMKLITYARSLAYIQPCLSAATLVVRLICQPFDFVWGKYLPPCIRSLLFIQIMHTVKRVVSAGGSEHVIFCYCQKLCGCSLILCYFFCLCFQSANPFICPSVLSQSCGFQLMKRKILNNMFSVRYE